MRFTFPCDFLWGSSISSYQTEGNNFTTDWYQWEKERDLEPAGAACRHYHLYREDVALAKSLSQNAFRFSLEWARIHPVPDRFNEEELRHYRAVLDSVEANGLVPVLTLHHFTNPLWFSEKGGWVESSNVEFFLRYVNKVVRTFGGRVRFWIVLNEPMVYVYNGFIQGLWPPGIRSLRQGRKAMRNLFSAYRHGYEEIKRLVPGDPQVSLAKHLRHFCGCRYRGGIFSSAVARMRRDAFNYDFLDRCVRKKVLDFIGVNYYCREYVYPSFSLFGKECRRPHHHEPTNTLGWRMSPESFYRVLCEVFSRYHLPIMVTENGTCQRSDDAYRKFLTGHIGAVARALNSGVDIRGYFWWSLLDNFEWDKGFAHRFGLAHVDFSAFQRTLRPFSQTYKRICQYNEISL